MTFHPRHLTRRLAFLLPPAMVVAALGCREDAQSPTAPRADAALDITPAQALSFRQVSGGERHTCGVTTDNRAYCWGFNHEGQLGTGTNTGPETCSGRPCSTRPVAVAGGLGFRQVSAGGDVFSEAHSCGVTTTNQAYCWGSNRDGQLGNGRFRDRPAPVAVAGGLRFRQVSVGARHTCGVTLDNRAYCWGHNGQGRLGDGTTDIDRPRPAAVSGGLFFLRVSAGADHTCGVTTNNRAFCWGLNNFGQLGEGGTVLQSSTPVAVASRRRFDRVTTGSNFFSPFTCAVTTDDRAFCWGADRSGQVGNGSPGGGSTPTAVVGGLRFLEVSAGGGHTCGVTTGNQAYCWGARGLLGDGTSNGSSRPVAVAGGLQLRQQNAGGSHTCGVTTDNVPYCWGVNDHGQLGDGSTTNRSTPVAVAGST